MDEEKINNFLECQEGFADFVSMMTGFKKQLTDQGWSDLNAEELVSTFMKQASR